MSNMAMESGSIYPQYECTDIAKDFFEACSELGLGELAQDDIFGLLESMSAIISKRLLNKSKNVQNHINYQNNQYARVMNLKYKSKYQKIKRIIKNYVFKNAALCDQIAQIQEDIITSNEELRFLLKRLIKHESDIELKLKQENNTSTNGEGTTPVAPREPGKRGPKKSIKVEDETPKKPKQQKTENRRAQKNPQSFKIITSVCRFSTQGLVLLKRGGTTFIGAFVWT